MFLDFCCMGRFITACFLVLEWMFFFRTRMLPDFGIQWCFASRYSMTLLLCVVLHPDIPWLCYYLFALHPDIPWLWFNVLFYIPIFRDFVTMHCFISGYSVTLLLCVVLYYDIPWLCYCVLFYITIFHDFATMCCFISWCVLNLWQCVVFDPLCLDIVTVYCFISGYTMTLLLCIVLHSDVHAFVTMCCYISRYSMTLLLCVVLYPDIPWLCFYVLFYIQCVLTKIRSFGDTIHLISQLSCWL